MITLLANQTATHLFYDACEHLNAQAVHCRGRDTLKEMPGPTAFELTDPRQNLVQAPARRLNPWVTLAEFPWMVLGRNDIRWLLRYLPRASEFSDDGLNWRAAYGRRLRAWYAPGQPGDYVDQLAYAIDQVNVGGRRSVMALWDPRVDQVPGSKDYPCTNLLTFQVRAHRVLDLSVTMRSNDLWWGWSGVNVFNFTTLLRAVAQWTGKEVGTYYHWSDNLHVYQRHFDALARATERDGEDMAWADEQETFGGTLLEFQLAAQRLMAVIEQGSPSWNRPEAVPAPNNSWLRDWAYFMTLHRYSDEPEVLERHLVRFEGRRKDWCRAAMAWAGRHAATEAPSL